MTVQLFNTRQKLYWKSERHLRRRDPTHPVIRAFVEPKIAHLQRVMRLPKHSSILDVGAGNGYFSHWLSTLGDVTAVDYSDVILAINPAKKKAVMDARSLSFPDETFDLTFCNALLHHVHRNDRRTVIREMARVSRKYVVIIEPNRWNPAMAAFSLWKREERGGLDFSLRTCRKMLERENVRILSATTWGLLTPNRMPFSRILLPLFRFFERSMPLGVSTIIIGEK